jgi:hypothetical protein
MTPLERAQYDLAEHQAGRGRRSHDDRGSNSVEDARWHQGRNWDRWDSYDPRGDL